MQRRLTVALAATAALGVSAVGLATTAGAAAKKNEIRIVGGVTVKAGQFVKDDQRFAPRNITVKSGATVTLRNRATTPDPHTISFVKKRFLPKQFESAAFGPLFAAHQATQDNAPPAVLIVDNGQPGTAPLNVDTLGDDKTAGDSQFIAPGEKKITFKVTAKKGARLYYLCAIHPWMQGKIKVN